MLLYNELMKQRVSIIIPTFNEEEYLPKLLFSLQKQTLQPKEIIVCDAYSTDDTRQIAKLYGCKVIEGGRPAHARNSGASVATGDILLFLDADVVLPTTFLEKTLTEFEHRRLDIASCYVTPLSTLTVDHMLHSVVNYYMRFTSQFYPHIPGFCIFVKKTIHNKINGFNEELLLAEDHDYVNRAQQHGKFSYLTCYKIPVSVRRLAEEGRLRVALKYIAIEVHLFLLGSIKENIFQYDFGKHYK